ncbi:hypothetical protein [Roseovarius sp. SCSIO 43702]|uniref:hypothetical protein n=1 Tax=Roseovarius sp. SCSIO 43702 TaxID=2823043 RepID=UPI0021760440|nr:hypothetical protein [Roseovarius sp. SCSIO 43702]
MAGALLRTFFVVLLITTPSLLLPGIQADTSQMVLMAAVIGGGLVFAEYFGKYPSLIEFRFAAPYNRLKFSFTAAAVLLMTLILRAEEVSGGLNLWATNLAQLLDFPYSPVRSVVSVLPADAGPEQIRMVTTLAGLSYLLSLLLVVTFVIVVRLLDWPVRNGAFNVSLNMPLFDPTGGGDVVDRLVRDASINISLGFLLPFLVPLAALALPDFAERFGFLERQNLIWMTCFWAFVPASMVMRGIALYRISDLINEKRRRAYAKTADGLQTV